MTTPRSDNNDEILRKRWLSRYLALEAKQDSQLRKLLNQAAADAEAELSVLSKSSVFSRGVRTAQLRILMQEIREILNDTFGKFTPVLSDGTKSAANTAVTAFTETDRQYLERAFAESGDPHLFIEGQRREVQARVATLVTKLNNFEYPLSGRVYRTRRQAESWVRNQVSRQLLIGTSAQDIAKTVRKSIRTNTPGGVGYAALRLGRTELNNAFHATSIEMAKDRPWVEGMLWNTSRVHKEVEGKVEICESYRDQIFSVDQVPRKPHPQCRCYATPEVEPFESFLTHLTAGQYRSWISENAPNQ